ncbi:MAG: GLPGLI family protein [Flavobacterium sp.]|nr:GLPGLI family protein [Flavobacterium sp.]
MKIKVIIVLIGLLVNQLYSQNGIIYYEYTDAIGVGDGNGMVYNAYTMFTKNKSYYVVAKDSLENSISKDRAKDHYQNADGSKNSITNGLVLTTQGEQVVCNYDTKEMWSNIYDGKHVYIKEELPKFNWKITKKKKKIASFDCILGETTFRGRTYYAWYTPSIPVYSGPWKLNGLPGLILEAYDEGKYLKWEFKSYKFPVDFKQNYTIRKAKGEKVKFLNIDGFKEYCLNKIESDFDRLIIIAKDHPGMTPIKEPMTSYYLESFE